MKKEDLIKLGLDEELAQKVADASAEELKGFIPKQRFDDVNTAKKQLEQDLKARDEQLTELSKIDADGLQAKIKELQDANDLAKTEYEKQLAKQQFDFALKDALSGAKAKNPKAVEALLNKELIKLDGDKLLGLEEQLKTIQENDSYLFDVQTEKPPKPQFSGGQHNPPANSDPFVSALLGK